MADVHCRVVGEDRLLSQLELLKSIRPEYLASTACSCQRLLEPSGSVRLPWLLKRTAPVRTAVRAMAYGSHSLLNAAVPTSRAADGR
jgi:hypothetical protein